MSAHVSRSLPALLSYRKLTLLTSEKASRNSLLPSAILASTSFLSPPRLSARPIPPALAAVAATAALLPSAGIVPRSNSPRVSRAALVAASCKLAERRRFTLRLSGLRVLVEGAEGLLLLVARGEREGRIPAAAAVLDCAMTRTRRVGGGREGSTRRRVASSPPTLHSLAMTASTTPAAAPHQEEQYLTLVRTILEQGQTRPDRTGTGTISLFAPPQLRFNLSKVDSTTGEVKLILPLLTTKKVFTRGIIEELLWFVAGSTDSKLLSDKGVKIWDGNGSREFLDKVGLSHREEGDLGPVYGFQWRHFGAEYGTCKDDYSGKGVDQLAECIRKIKENPMDRRIILSAWNPAGESCPLVAAIRASAGPPSPLVRPPADFLPCPFADPIHADLSKMALPPCHMFCQFYVTLPPANSPPSTKNRLSCIMYQRSADCGLGVPFNITSYALLLHMMAYVTDTIPHEFVHQLGDAHVYRDHVEPLKEQLERTPYEFPEFRWRRTSQEVGEIDGFKLEDFEVVGYKSHPRLDMKMSV